MVFLFIYRKIRRTRVGSIWNFKSLFVFIGIPVWSFASTSNTIISNIIGQNRINDVIPVLKVLAVSVGLSMSINIIILLFPNAILSIFTNDSNIIRDAIPPFYTLMIAMLFFSSSMIMNFGITGTQVPHLYLQL